MCYAYSCLKQPDEVWRERMTSAEGEEARSTCADFSPACYFITGQTVHL